jgi:hypothetical protein
VAPAGPDATTAVTVTPAWLAALPAPSRSCTTGCCANATPLWAVADGCVVTLSCVAAPALRVIVPEAGVAVSPVASKCNV